MQLLDWPFLDALQAGALAALCISFAADAFIRRDRMVGWLALACLLVSLRHGVLALGVQADLNPHLVDRAQSLLMALGFLALCAAFTRLFQGHIPKRFPLWVAVALIPNFLRNLVLPHPSLGDTWMHNASNFVYLVSCHCIIYWTYRARQEGNPLGRRLFLGFLGVSLPVVVELAAFSLFDLKIRLTGFSLLILALAIGSAWQWLVVSALESRIRLAEKERESWQSLAPGRTFRTDRAEPAMAALFGAAWADQVKAAPDLTLLGTDGNTYRVQSRALEGPERLGWCDRDEASGPSHRDFLSGWTVALGMDDPGESDRILALLHTWGAEVEPWGTVPPREGPFPSVLLWAREPSILTVWREGNLRRRRPRWIQVGGPATEGPHARLETGVSGDELRQTLEELLSRR
jgi:hypothetical protein